MGKKESLQLFFKDPYVFIDSHDPSFLGFHPNFLRSDSGLRRAFTVPIIIAVIAWAVMGWDSSDQQIWDALWALTGGQGWEVAELAYFNAYGKFQHWSAYVIYGLMWIGLSKHLSKIGLRNSENIVYSTCFTLFSVGVFEYFWNISYAYFQDQRWTVTFQMPQLRILAQNLIFLTLGAMRLVNINWKLVKLNISRETLFYLLFALVFAEVWYFYGDYFPVQRFSVYVEGYGVWTNSNCFPQTIYTVDLNLLDKVSVGEQYYLSNDLIHLVNILSKVSITMFIYSLFKLRRREK